VDGAGTNNCNDSIILSGEDVGNLLTSISHYLSCLCRDRQFFHENVWSNELVKAIDSNIVEREGHRAGNKHPKFPAGKEKIGFLRVIKGIPD
jgi:hypothetical protein